MPIFSVYIRELEGIEDFTGVQALEKEVWNLADIDVIPITLAIASKEAGCLWLGAFDEKILVGFAYAFPAIKSGAVSFHSHQLAVRPEYREFGVGYNLKVAQREHIMAVHWGGVGGTRGAGSELALSANSKLGIAEITWTFDPLQSKNAHLNFGRLGVISDNYKVDLYGPATSSALHRNGTDRLWVRWPIISRRVATRVAGKEARADILDALSNVRPLISFGGNGNPIRSDLTAATVRQRIAIEIPSDIGAIEKQDFELARQWREATRWAFTESLKAGFFVAEFCRNVRGQQGPGAYLLEKGTVEDYVPEMARGL